MTELRPLEGVAPKWQLAYFGPRIGYYGHIFWDMDFKFVLPIIYINIDIQTKLEVNWTWIGHFSPQKPPKNH